MDSKDKALTRLFMASCFHKWSLLPDLGQRCLQAGCNVAEIRGCVRHLVVVAGYGPCLAATNHLHAAKILTEDTPGKVSGGPGNPFELVYGGITETVRRKMHTTDPTLCEWIRLHLYGDVYTSPGITLKQKQLLMVAFLGEAEMHEQLFGHLIAALKFGNDKAACLKAIDIGFELAANPKQEIYKGALKTLQLAYHKYKKDFAESPAFCPEIYVTDPQDIRIPDLVLSNGFEIPTELKSNRNSALALSEEDSIEKTDLPKSVSEAAILNHRPDLED